MRLTSLICMVRPDATGGKATRSNKTVKIFFMQAATGNKVLLPAYPGKGDVMIQLTYYLDVMSSWCFYVEPSLDRLRQAHGNRIKYDWRIAMVTEGGPEGWGYEQMAWFYKRSGSVSGVTLNPEWNRGPHSTLQPNLAAEAARELGCTDDRVRRALARAALIDGISIYHKGEAVTVAAAAGGLKDEELFKMMDDPRIEERIRKSGAEFASYHIDQRPGFVMRSDIGDTAIFSGLWRFEPLDATTEAMLKDEDKYAKFAANDLPFPAPKK
jgi:predicted DsbA family dithiol-disulfide isomerase